MAKRDRNMERCRLAGGGGGGRLVVSRALSGLEAEQPGRRLVTGKALSFIESSWMDVRFRKYPRPKRTTQYQMVIFIM